ncbi:MAG: hypothetical protein ACFE7R_11530, partial [Candidatus Hodarchaeota archaeon]
NDGVEKVLFCVREITNYSIWKNTNIWTASISNQPAGSVISFRVFAKDWAGNWGVPESVNSMLGALS